MDEKEFFQYTVIPPSFTTIERMDLRVSTQLAWLASVNTWKYRGKPAWYTKAWLMDPLRYFNICLA
jgi:hypothetical protein